VPSGSATGSRVTASGPLLRWGNEGLSGPDSYRPRAVRPRGSTLSPRRLPPATCTRALAASILRARTERRLPGTGRQGGQNVRHQDRISTSLPPCF
jgi:hypothetical protein